MAVYTPNQTTLELMRILGIEGENGRYITKVVVTLTAEDYPTVEITEILDNNLLEEVPRTFELNML